MIRRTRPLDAVAGQTGSSVERLREWCATGLLQCDRVAGEWALPESELAAAHALAAVGPRLADPTLPDGGHLLAVAFPDHPAASRALDAIRSRTGVRPRDVELAPLSIDGQPMVLVAGRVPARHRDEIESIVRESGGRLIDGATTGVAPGEDFSDERVEGFGA
ncbi:MAG TPA: hypothetical protein VIK65_03120 [Candidatus Limnocylindrales bacterium]